MSCMKVTNTIHLIRKIVWNILLYLGLSLGRVPKYKSLVRIFTLVRPINIGIDLVRVGGDNDGAYLLPEDLDGITAVFSPGVATEFSFEKTFADQGIPCFMIDGSVDSPPSSHENFFFEKLWLSPVTKKGESISLDDWIHKAPASGDLVLQMDIEGAEFGCLITAKAATLQRFRVIVVEYHNLGQMLNVKSLRRVQGVFEKLSNTHTVVHAHANNCCPVFRIRKIRIPTVIEVTYIRNDRVKERNGFASIPHEQDQLNVPDNPAVELRW